MTQIDKWMARYGEVISFIETNHRNPIPEQVLASLQWQATRSSAPTRSLSKYVDDESGLVNWCSTKGRSSMRELMEGYKRVNQYQ